MGINVACEVGTVIISFNILKKNRGFKTSYRYRSL